MCQKPAPQSASRLLLPCMPMPLPAHPPACQPARPLACLSDWHASTRLPEPHAVCGSPAQPLARHLRIAAGAALKQPNASPLKQPNASLKQRRGLPPALPCPKPGPIFPHVLQDNYAVEDNKCHIGQVGRSGQPAVAAGEGQPSQTPLCQPGGEPSPARASPKACMGQKSCLPLC